MAGRTFDASTGDWVRDPGGRPVELPASQGRGLATAERVHAACDHLLARGTRITEPAIREIVGGGSKTSIYAHIETWYGRLQDELRELRAAGSRPALPDLPAPLAEALNDTWRVLTTQAHAAAAATLQADQLQLQRDRAVFVEEIQRERERLTAERSRWAAERDALVTGRDNAIRAHFAERERTGELQTALAMAEERLARNSEQAASALVRVRELEAALVDAGDRHSRDTAALLVRFDSERQALSGELASTQARSREAAERASRFLEREREARAALDAERVTLHKNLEALRSDLKQSEANLCAKEAELSDLALEMAGLQAALCVSGNSDELTGAKRAMRSRRPLRRR